MDADLTNVQRKFIFDVVAQMVYKVFYDFWEKFEFSARSPMQIIKNEFYTNKFLMEFSSWDKHQKI